jgi:hypothetical protein
LPQWPTRPKPTMLVQSGSPWLAHAGGAWPVHLHGSDYKPPHRELEEAARGVVLTGEALGAAATDGVDGGNGSQVSEGTNSLAPCNTHFLQE